jgi:hypothetical protein
MLKVTSLSAIISPSAQRTSFDEEKEEEGIFSSAVPHIQNRMVTSTKTHSVHDQDLSSSSPRLILRYLLRCPPYHYFL